MRERGNNEHGFSLFEAIISVAAISLISLFILQIFIASANGNQKAQDIDVASYKAQAVIEEIKSISFDDAKNIAVLEHADISELSGEEGGFQAHVYFDKNWELLPSDEKAHFIMDVSVSFYSTLSKEYLADLPMLGRMATIAVSVWYEKTLKEDRIMLVNYYTSKYYK